MDEYTAGCSQIEKLVNATQRMRECLICSICLDTLKEPVIIKCGHRFCRSCILQVVGNKVANCPCCNKKIQKRSIPKEDNEVLEKTVKLFNELTKAISKDSSIDVSEPFHKRKHTKDSTAHFEGSHTLKDEQASIISKGSSKTKNSVNSKIHSQSNRRASQKKPINKETKSNEKKNTLHKYLSNKLESPHQVQSEEKVKSWLKNLSSDIDEGTVTDFSSKESSSSSKKITEDPELSFSKENPTNLFPKIYPSAKEYKQLKAYSTEHTNQINEDSKYKNIQMKVQEAEMIARKKRLNQNVPDRSALKTPSSVPATSHSDAYDWRRIKRVGKEMQPKTFKSLSVSVEKNTSSIVLDDTVPCNSTYNDSKYIKDSDSKDCSSKNVTVIEAKHSVLKKSDDEYEKITIQDKHESINSSGSQNGNISFISSMDQKQINNVIGILNAPSNFNTPEKARNIGNLEGMSAVNCLSPLQMNIYNKSKEPEFSGDELLNIESKDIDTNFQSSPLSKRKLSLKMTLKSGKNVSSASVTANKIGEGDERENDLPSNWSPERPRSRLSLRLATSNTTNTNNSFNKIKSPVKYHTHSGRSPRSSSRFGVTFRKLGKLSKPRKKIPFLYLGKLKPKQKLITCNSKNQDTSGILVKSIVSTNIDYKVLKRASLPGEIKLLSPEKDSQLKFVLTGSPDKEKEDTTVSEINENEKSVPSNIRESNYVPVPMEIDESLCADKKLLLMQKTDENINNNKIEYEEQSRASLHTEVIKNDHTTLVKPEDTFMNNEKIKIPLASNDSELISYADVENCEKSNLKDTETEKLGAIKKIRNIIQDDLISISSSDSMQSNIESHSIHKPVPGEKNLDKKNKNDIIEIKSNPESSSTYDPKDQQKSEKSESEKSSTTTSSSSCKTSPSKKKRSYSESSNDDDVSSIIGKWCETMEEQVIKKPKVSSEGKELNLDQIKINSKMTEIGSSSSSNTLVTVMDKQLEINQPQTHSPIDEIIKKVKEFKNNDLNTSKLVGMPSSLLSADLFESHENILQPRIDESSKEQNQIININTGSPTNSHKDNVDNEDNGSDSENYSDLTMMDLIQFNKKEITVPENLDVSNKENQACNVDVNKSFKVIDHIEDQIDEIASSQKEKSKVSKDLSLDQIESYFISDSLMNITQEQLAMKKIEKELIGDDTSVMQTEENDKNQDNNTFTTPRRKFKDSHVDEKIDEDCDNINATPVVKKRQTFNFSRLQANTSETGASEDTSPIKDLDSIPAITPMRNTKFYPLCHSTPMINSSDPDIQTSSTRNKNITFICTGMGPESNRILHNFMKKFKANFQNEFNMKVTHVIVQTDPETKSGKKTFKYIQGIAFKKYVVSFQWIIDCLSQNKLLDEDDEKYEVLDPDVLESGTKKSRFRAQDLFEGFAFFCLKPFTAFSVKEFKNVLVHNGAVVVNSVKELARQTDKFRVIILESENLTPNRIALLKESKSILVSFEWVVDSLSQYHLLSLVAYFYKTSTSEALALGFPPEFLIEEEDTLPDFLDITSINNIN